MFSNAFDEPHNIIASLPLPVYITTNYDDFMIQALQHCGKDPKQELCRWNNMVKDQPSVFESQPEFIPTQANPVVFHLHGHNNVVESIVLTEDDYLEFIVNISRDQSLIPPRIQQAISGASLIFIGYSLDDWSFRVLFRGLIESTESNLRRISITVQLPPATRETQNYMDKYFNWKNLKVYWGTAREFVAELDQRWRDYLK